MNAAFTTVGLIGKYTNAYANPDTATVYNGVGIVQGATIAATSANAAWTSSAAKAAGCDPVICDAEFYVPPGFTFWDCLIGDGVQYGGGAQDHYNVRHLRYQGANPADGDGIECTTWSLKSYTQTPTSITRSANVGTVNLTGHGLSVGDEFAITAGTTTDPSAC